MNEIEKFVESKRKLIREFFERNQKDLNNKVDINSIDDAYIVLFQLIDKNLDIIVKLKNDLEKSNDDQEKVQLENMIGDMMRSVTENLSACPQ